MVIEIEKGEKLILPILYARTYIGEHSVDSSLFTESVEYDLLDLEYYIHIHLWNPQVADRIVDGIIDTIGGLEIYFAIVNGLAFVSSKKIKHWL